MGENLQDSLAIPGTEAVMVSLCPEKAAMLDAGRGGGTGVIVVPHAEVATLKAGGQKEEEKLEPWARPGKQDM